MSHHPISPGIDRGAERERALLWRHQTLLSAANAAGAIGLLWLSAQAAGGPGRAGAILSALMLAFVAGGAPAALAVAHGSRRRLLLGAHCGTAIALAAVLAFGSAPPTWVLLVAAVAVGAGRALYDAAATDILQQLVARPRVHDAMRDLTRRFGLGQAGGVALALGAGLLAGPRGVLAAAAVAAAAGALLALGHRRLINLRSAEALPANVAMGRAYRVVVQTPMLRRAVLGGAAAVALGSALSAMLILWLRDGVGLRGTLVPTLILGFMVVRLARPALAAAAVRIPSRVLVALALGIQAATAVAAHSANGMVGAALAYALSLAAGALLATLILRAHRRAAPHEVAPAVGAVCSMAWALAAAVGAGGAALLALSLGLAEAYLVLAAVGLAGAALTLTPVALRPLLRG